MSTRETVRESCRRAMEALDVRDGMLVGYSGGADSAALLHIADGFCREKGLRLLALHIHHGIRGAEADRDAAFCEDACRRMNIPFRSLYADIPALAREAGEGLEETARRFRYEAFERICREEGLSCVLTAHHADDHLETLIFHLIRGSGTGGLCGIAPVRRLGECRAARPLLSCTKSDILGYCEENGIEYILDSTNLDTAYTRNYIRSEILPRLKELNPSAARAALHLSENLRQDAECLGRMTDEWLVSERAGSLSLAAIGAREPALVSRAFRSRWREISCGGELQHTHITALHGLAERAVRGSSLNLPGGVIARIDGDRMCFYPASDRRENVPFGGILKEGINLFDGADFAVWMGFSALNPGKFEKDNEWLKNIYNLSIHTRINSDKIKCELSVRRRCPGDAYRFGGMTRTLKRLFCDRKMTADEKAAIPVFCDREGIFWVPSFPLRDGAGGDGQLDLIVYYRERPEFGNASERNEK